MQLEPGIHLVEGVASNVYLIADGDDLTLIDSGLPGSAKGILSYLARIGCQPSALKRILLTHQHVDHVGGAAELARQTGAEVWAHPLDTPAIEGKARREAPHGPLGLIFRLVLLPRIQPVSIARQVSDGDVLPVLAQDGGLVVVATHGHTVGHVSFYVPGRKLLFPGDAYRHTGAQDVRLPSARLNHDSAQARTALKRLAALDVEASLPGHGKPILHAAGERIAQAAG